MLSNPPQPIDRPAPTDAQPASPDAHSVASARLPIVAIGASAGGLDAVRKLLAVIRTPSEMAFVLVQHLDPNHASMVVELLASHTKMEVVEAEDGMSIVANRLYVIPPGKYLSIAKGLLHLTHPTELHGARLPVNCLLTSLARDRGREAIAIILSGMGSDGSLGARAIHAAGGMVIVQSPAEASYDSMPSSVIAAGVADRILTIAEMPAALGDVDGRGQRTTAAPVPEPPDLTPILELIRAKTSHDFTHYKTGTLRRRIERRMVMANLLPADTNIYLERLVGNAGELDKLASDLLINVTQFFRDPQVFDYLADQIVPDILNRHVGEEPIRIWIVGCSSGEEAFSLAMVFRERMELDHPEAKLQVFASDVDANAIVQAREGLFPASIADDVTPERLERFFLKDETGYRIVPDLRASVVFTVQDVLVDPPFSRLDFISCRNMLIYLAPEAQAKAIGLFHFALKKGGILLLGSSETVGEAKNRFDLINKSVRIYRHIGVQSRLELGSVLSGADTTRPSRALPGQPVPRALALGDVARQRIFDAFAPASVLINRKGTCIYSLGALNGHLSVPPGYPTQDIYAMTVAGLHPKLRLAIQRAADEARRVTIPAGRFERNGRTLALSLSAEPVTIDGEGLTLISFLESPFEEPRSNGDGADHDGGDSGLLEYELRSTRADLAEALNNLRSSADEQNMLNAEALSVNQEYQSTNEELLASKEELQSVNEELTALNGQLQETLDRQRTTSNDLQNVLYSTDVATLFLDLNLRIRFFTPSTKSLFNVIPSDVGRPLADLHALAVDETFLSDAVAVLAKHTATEREVQAHAGAWYIRRILPYRTHADIVEGVVVTFTDVTERRRIADALQTAKRRAQQADAAKSRFLAAASHDLRQPLQTLALLQGLLAQTVEGEKAKRLVTRLDDTLGSMAAMLNTLLDINQIEAGTVSAEIVRFPLNALLTRLRDEFSYAAEAQGLQFRVVATSMDIVSDPRLIEQMIRNILSNALKYTKTGKILLGCRRRGEHIHIEIWDSGLGIPESELQSIFEEYHQIGNAERERAKGLGLGLAIVKRLGDLLGHSVDVRSQLGKGSVFTIETQSPEANRSGVKTLKRLDAQETKQNAALSGTVLVIEDGPDIRLLLEALLSADGHKVATASDGITAIDMITRNLVRPDLILADFNLPNGMTGLQIATKARHILHRSLPVIILSGDIAAGTLADIAAENCVHLAKPVKLGELRLVVQRKLAEGLAAKAHAVALPTPSTAPALPPVVYVVDDDENVRQGICDLLQGEGRGVEDFASCEAFIAAFRPSREACLLIDASLPGMSGLDLLRHLKAEGHTLPAIMITGNGDVAIAVAAMKAGASDFIEKPVASKALVAAVARALELARDGQKRSEGHETAVAQLAGLTPRQHQIMDLILAGHPNKNIAADLGLSQRTVENHRAAIMKRTGSTSLPDLARTAVAAATKT